VSINIGQTSPQVVTASLRALAHRRPLVVSGWSNKLGALISSRLPRVWMTRLTYLIMRKMRLNAFVRQKSG
jgi:short-subunit dehydrogenase